MYHYFRSKKFIGLIGGLLILILLLAALAIMSLLEHRRTLNNTQALAETIIVRKAAQFEAVAPLSAATKRRLRRYLNSVHVETARQLGVSGITNRKVLTQLKEEEKLIPLENNSYYYLQEMNASVPAVTPNAARLLELIGMRFQEALAEKELPPYRFMITSATRSRQDQADLTRTNINAAGKSSHEFGTTLDLHYAEFDVAEEALALPDTLSDYPKEIYPDVLAEKLLEAYQRFAQTQSEKLKAILGRVLLNLQEAGQVIVIYERRQPVYHITVADQIEAGITASREAPADSMP